MLTNFQMKFLNVLNTSTSVYVIRTYYGWLLFTKTEEYKLVPYVATVNEKQLIQWNTKLITFLKNNVKVPLTHIYDSLNWLISNNYISLQSDQSKSSELLESPEPKNISPEPEIKNTPTETKTITEPQSKKENTNNINLDDYVDFVF